MSDDAPSTHFQMGRCIGAFMLGLATIIFIPTAVIVFVVASATFLSRQSLDRKYVSLAFMLGSATAVALVGFVLRTGFMAF